MAFGSQSAAPPAACTQPVAAGAASRAAAVERWWQPRAGARLAAACWPPPTPPCSGLSRAHPPAAAALSAGGRRRRLAEPCCATGTDSSSSSGSSDGDGESGRGREDAERLNRLLAGPQSMTGQELRNLVMDKWGVSYDVRLQRRGPRMYLHVMWRFLEQQSFPLTEAEYVEQLEAVASYLNLWNVQDTVRAGIQSANKRGPGYTGGGNARAISIPLGVDVGGLGRSDEWNSF